MLAFLRESSRGSRVATPRASPVRSKVTWAFGGTVPFGKIVAIGPVSNTLTGRLIVGLQSSGITGHEMFSRSDMSPRDAVAAASRTIVTFRYGHSRTMFRAETPLLVVAEVTMSSHGPVRRIVRDDFCATVTRLTCSHSTVRVFCSIFSIFGSKPALGAMHSRLPIARAGVIREVMGVEGV